MRAETSRQGKSPHLDRACSGLRAVSHGATLPMQVKAVQEYLKELLENTDQKLLVFAHHKELLDGVEFAMNKCGPAEPSVAARQVLMA